MFNYLNPAEEAEVRPEIRWRAYQRRENFIKLFEEEYKDSTPDFVEKEGESARDAFTRLSEGRYHDDPRFTKDKGQTQESVPSFADKLREAFTRLPGGTQRR